MTWTVEDCAIMLQGPALAQCMGFTTEGLPLSLQIVGRPFDEATVLRAAYAYEKATPWRKRRPVLDPVRDMVVAACHRAGLSLNEDQIAMICAAAPYVTAVTQWLRRERDFREEPANIFRFPC